MSSLASGAASAPYVQLDKSFEVFLPIGQKTGSLFTLYAPGDNYYQTIISISFDLATSNAVGARTVALEVRDSSRTVVSAAPAAATQAPSTTASYQFSNTYTTGLSPSAARIAQPLWNYMLPYTYAIWVDTTNGDVADVYSGIAVYTRKFPTGALAAPAAEPLIPTPIVF